MQIFPIQKLLTKQFLLESREHTYSRGPGFSLPSSAAVEFSPWMGLEPALGTVLQQSLVANAVFYRNLD